MDGFLIWGFESQLGHDFREIFLAMSLSKEHYCNIFNIKLIIFNKYFSPLQPIYSLNASEERRSRQKMRVT